MRPGSPARRRGAVMLLRHHREPGWLVLTLDGATEPGDVVRLQDEATLLVTDEPGQGIVVDLALVRPSEIGVVDAVMHLLLVARRDGRSFHVRHAHASMRTLLELVGLDAVLRVDARCSCRTCR